MNQGFTISFEYELQSNFGGDEMKKNQPIAQPVIEIDPLKGAEQHAEIPVGDYTIHMALAEATEKYRNSIRPIDRRTIFRAAQTIFREKQAATQLPRRFEGENEYQAWLESQGLMESDDYGYVSQTGRKIFPSQA